VGPDNNGDPVDTVPGGSSAAEFTTFNEAPPAGSLWQTFTDGNKVFGPIDSSAEGSSTSWNIGPGVNTIPSFNYAYYRQGGLSFSYNTTFYVRIHVSGHPPGGSCAAIPQGDFGDRIAIDNIQVQFGNPGQVLLDPHFLGLNNVPFDINDMKYDNRVFRIWKDDHLAINARFAVRENGFGLYMTEFGVRLGDKLFKINGNGGAMPVLAPTPTVHNATGSYWFFSNNDLCSSIDETFTCSYANVFFHIRVAHSRYNLVGIFNMDLDVLQEMPSCEGLLGMTLGQSKEDTRTPALQYRWALSSDNIMAA